MRPKLVLICLLLLTTPSAAPQTSNATPQSALAPPFSSVPQAKREDPKVMDELKQQRLPLVMQAKTSTRAFGTVTETITATVQPLSAQALAPRSALFINRSVGWIATDHTLIATSDGGASWTAEYTSTAPITALDMVSAQNGWMIAGEQLLATSDGGASWRTVALPVESLAVDAINLVDDWNGWLTTDHTTFWHTTDGGTTWTTVPYPPCQYREYDLFSFPTPRDGWVLCAVFADALPPVWKQLWRTRDAGATWELGAMTDEQHDVLPGGYVLDMTFLDSQHGWMTAGFKGMNGLEYTSDGGRTWQAVGNDFYEAGGQYARSIRFWNSNRGVLVVDRARPAVLTTEDGGITWRQVYPTMRPTGKVWFFDGREGIGMGYPTNPDAVLGTVDGGQTWRPLGEVVPGRSCELATLSFPTSRDGWASAICEERTELYRSADGGASWQQLTLPTDPANRSTAASNVDGLTGYVGTIFALFQTHDGGLSFQHVSTGRAFPDFRFVTEQYGWARGDGTLFETSDGGKSWNEIVLPVRVWDYDLRRDGLGWFTTDCGGDGCTLLTTRDNGRTWKRITFEALRVDYVTFADAQHGWLVGILGGFYITDDGGATWRQIA